MPTGVTPYFMAKYVCNSKYQFRDRTGKDMKLVTLLVPLTEPQSGWSFFARKMDSMTMSCIWSDLRLLVPNSLKTQPAFSKATALS